MHGISHLLSHHNSHNGETVRMIHHHHPDNSKSSPSPSSPDTVGRHHDTKILQELLNQKNIQKRISRGSVSSTYSYGSSASYGSSHGSNSSNHSSSSHHHHSVYHTIHGSGHHHHQQLHHHHHHHHHLHQHQRHLHHLHHHPPSTPLHPLHQQQQQQQQHHLASSGRASPTSPSGGGEHEQKQHHQKDHHHYSIQEMIRHFGRRLGHMRRQSECQDPPRKKEEDFRNRSQSLDGGVRYPNLRDADCETTYRIYESILRQGNRNVEKFERNLVEF